MKYLLLLASLMGSFVWAEMDAASQDAVTKTQNLMNSPTDRKQYIDAHPDAKAADDRARNVAGSPADVDAMYGISGSILSSDMKSNGGNPKVEMERLQKANENPEAFFNSLSPEQQAQIKALAEKIEGEKGTPGGGLH